MGAITNSLLDDTGPDFGHPPDSAPKLVDKELEWKRNKIGFFSASELHRLMSKSDSWTQENINYLYEIQYAREQGVFLSAPANRNFRLGHENEPLAVEWLREHFNPNIRHYDVDFDEKPFIKTDFGFGLSPDCDIFEDNAIQAIVEIKSAVGNEERSKMFSPTFPYDKKRMRVWAEHNWQIIGQFVGLPELQIVHLLKYDSVDDYNETDLRPPTLKKRGVIFTFKRQECGKAIPRAIERLTFADKYLRDELDPDNINEYWKKRPKLFL